MKRYIYIQIPHSVSKVAEACLFLTPEVFILKNFHLVLEISSTQKFFGGEVGLLTQLDKILSLFFKEEEEKNWVVLDNPAWGGCFLQQKNLILPMGQSQSYLMKLSLGVLVFCGDSEISVVERKGREQLVSFMYRIGMQTVTDFMRLTPLAISRRFGKMGVLISEWLRGDKKLILSPFISTEKLEEKIPGERLYSLESLLFILKGVLHRFEFRMKGLNLTAKTMRFNFFLEDKKSFIKEISFSQSLQETEKIFKILKEFLSSLTWEAPVSQLEVVISETHSHKAAQLSLWDNLENRYGDLNQFLMQLQSKYSRAVVGYPHLSENHFPEKSWGLKLVPSRQKLEKEKLIARPLFLFSKPKPVSLSKDTKFFQSEEIVTDWWEDSYSTRRYFIAKQRDQELWVYFDSQERKWFLHGAFN